MLYYVVNFVERFSNVCVLLLASMSGVVRSSRPVCARYQRRMAPAHCMWKVSCKMPLSGSYVQRREVLTYCIRGSTRASLAVVHANSSLVVVVVARKYT